MSKTEVTVVGTVKVTIETIENIDGSLTYRVCGRRLGKMEYQRDFDNFKDARVFVNRSAGQSLRFHYHRAFTAGYLQGFAEAGGIIAEGIAQ